MSTLLGVEVAPEPLRRRFRPGRRGSRATAARARARGWRRPGTSPRTPGRSRPGARGCGRAPRRPAAGTRRRGGRGRRRARRRTGREPQRASAARPAGSTPCSAGMRASRLLRTAASGSSAGDDVAGDVADVLARLPGRARATATSGTPSSGASRAGPPPRVGPAGATGAAAAGGGGGGDAGRTAAASSGASPTTIGSRTCAASRRP